MKIGFILSICLLLNPLFAQFPMQKPVVRPPIYNHPNTTPPNSDLPPAPNHPNPYNPYGSINGAPGSAFTEAMGAAMHFINIVDNQQYGDAWLDASGILHDVVPQDVWSAGMRAIRMHLGYVKTRKICAHRNLKALPGQLVGEFIIIQYTTEFANRPNATEIVTLMMQAPLGLWKVVCYTITSSSSIHSYHCR